MMARVKSLFDPLVRLLLLAIVLASIVPVTGEGRVIARLISDAAIFLLFLLNGLRLPRQQVLQGMRNARFLLPLVAWVFGAMGLAGWGLSLAGEGVLPPTVALGLLFLGLLPSTVQSATAYSSLAGGNVAASVVAAAVINVLGVFITAPLVSLAAGAAVGIDLAGLQRIGLILLLPFAVGQVLQSRLGQFIAENRAIISWADRGAISIAVYVAFSAAVEQGLWTLVSASAWMWLALLIAAFLLVGFVGSWLLGGALGLDRGDRIAFLFAGAQKSIALGAPLASVLFPPATAGLVLLPVLAYHLTQMIVSAPLAGKLSRASARP
ncbi:bile acid:sodium symporter [Aurantiacibacter poecillastricola]|uniref:bile acid:sodium symporter n=1 Tax=Aurantiacibacter poecillastricola TaxID=3064385 RepID=UPI00273E5235|nr:bile acid:sodium symporter [Aurantiacibacter sp. 219JJ12-13]MDP5261887.1 bile acid:sodium symporter [Aurantiacibacter sp. 219JJ12-13]